MKKYFTLDDFLEKDSLVLFDTSLFAVLDCSFLYSIQSYRQIKEGYLESTLEKLEKLLEFTESEKTKTISEVYEEFLKLSKICSTKQKFLNKNLPNKRFKISARDEKKKGIFSRINLKISEITKSIKSSIINLEKERIFLVFDQFIESLKNYFVDEHFVNRLSSCDQKLIATAFYLSCYQNKPSILLSQDKGLLKLAQMLKLTRNAWWKAGPFSLDCYYKEPDQLKFYYFDNYFFDNYLLKIISSSSESIKNCFINSFKNYQKQNEGLY